MGIKEDFEKDFEKNDKLHWSGMSGGEIEIARWAAKWMAKYLENCCCVEFDSHNKEAYITNKEIRQLVKEME